jgi:hypothetical protein
MENCKPGKMLLRSTFILLYLVSCATRSENPAFSPVYVTDRAKFVLLPAAEIEAPMDGPQQISGSYGKQEFIMEAWVKADENEVNMALFNSFGADMGDFSFRDEGILLSSPVFPDSFKAEYLAADFQFCFYKAEALETALKKCGLSLELEKTGLEQANYHEIRRIREGEKVIIEIEKTGEQVRYRNLLRGYSYTLGGSF